MIGYRNTFPPLLPVLVLGILSGCSSLPERDSDGWSATLPLPPVSADESNGAIYQAGRDVALFEDVKARRVGDLLTVRLVEQTDASKSSTTSTSKTTDNEIASPTLLGQSVTRNGIPILSGTLDSDQSFSGAGDSSQSNSLEGSITVTIAERLSNGYLVIRGEKWVELNQGREFTRISGIVRPVDIGPDNTILSSQVANARIAYGGKGALADANRMGFLARFFNHPWVPF